VLNFEAFFESECVIHCFDYSEVERNVKCKL